MVVLIERKCTPTLPRPDEDQAASCPMAVRSVERARLTDRLRSHREAPRRHAFRPILPETAIAVMVPPLPRKRVRHTDHVCQIEGREKVLLEGRIHMLDEFAAP